MSRSPDVAVIGGGIIGCSAAALLAERGASVVLFEGTAIGAGASGRNLGAIQHPFDAVLAPLYRASLEHYRELARHDGAFPMPEQPVGVLMLNHDADASRRQVEHLRAAVPDLGVEFLDADAVATAEPSLVPGLSACRLATGYPIPPASATGAYSRLADQRGAEIRVGAAARPWVEGGVVRGVTLADGTQQVAGKVLVAGGPWSPPLIDPTGAWAPIRRTWGVTVQLDLRDAAPHQVVEEDEVDAVNRPLVAAARAADGVAEADPPSLFSLASAGGVSTLGSTFLPRDPDAPRMARLLIERGAAYLPAIASAPVLEVRVCARPQSADSRPFIGPVGGLEGLFVCAGHGPWGISTGPASAELVVEAILKGTPIGRELAAMRGT
ncbi:MAG: NAD(P)/FAD-dependent oxidoreductase [Candidatus Limnocylindria bacterium]